MHSLTFLDGYFMPSLLSSEISTSFPFSLRLTLFSVLTKLKHQKRIPVAPATTSGVQKALASIWHYRETVCASIQGQLLHFTSGFQPLSLIQRHYINFILSLLYSQSFLLLHYPLNEINRSLFLSSQQTKNLWRSLKFFFVYSISLQ